MAKPGPGGDEEDARALFEEARALADRGDFAAACPKFEAARARFETAGVLINLADCYEHTGRLASALRTYDDAVVLARDTGRTHDADESQSRRDALSERVSRVTLQTDHETPGMTVLWDGAPWPRSTWSSPRPVDPGVHTLSVRAPGQIPWEGPVVVIGPAQATPVLLPHLAPEGAGAQDAGSTRPSLQPNDDEHLPLVWVQGSIGVGTSDVESIAYVNGVSGQTTSPGGPVFSGAAGLHIGAIRFGLRARNLAFSGFNVWEWGGEVAVQGRADRTLVYLGIRGGYAEADVAGASITGIAGTGTTAAATTTSADTSGDGFNVGLMVGLDYFVTRFFSMGIDLNPELLDIHRPPLSLPAGVTEAQLPPEVQALQAESGIVVGAVFVGSAHLGLHF